MLKIFRNKNVAKMVLWGILILTLPAFVLWGTGSLSGPKNKGPRFVGTINGKKVSFDDFAKSLIGIRCQIVLNYAGQTKLLEVILENKALSGKLAWDRLTMLMEARKYGIKVSDKEVINYIRTYPLFISNGRFDDRLYGYFLRNNIGLEGRSFEEMARDNIKIRKLNDIISKDVAVSDDEALEDYRANSERFKISYVMFYLNDFLGQVKVEDAEAKDYYEKHKDEFVLPPPKDAAEKKEPTIARLEDVSASIKTYLGEGKARYLAMKDAQEKYGKLAELMKQEKISFEKACAKLQLKAQQTGFISKSDYLTGIGEVKSLIDLIVKMKKDDISTPVKMRGGALVFQLLEAQSFDEKRFQKEKAEYSSIVLQKKKSKFLEGWLRKLEARNTLNIDLKEYEKYYR